MVKKHRECCTKTRYGQGLLQGNSREKPTWGARGHSGKGHSTGILTAVESQIYCRQKEMWLIQSLLNKVFYMSWQKVLTELLKLGKWKNLEILDLKPWWGQGEWWPTLKHDEGYYLYTTHNICNETPATAFILRSNGRKDGNKTLEGEILGACFFFYRTP